MGAETGIAWTDHTFNPWWGCEKISPGCAHCYAAAWDARFFPAARGAGKANAAEHWGANAPRRFFGEAHWREPRKWNADAQRAHRRDRVFCASMADVFEDRDDLDNVRRVNLWPLIRDTPHLDWQLLTKRPENILRLLPAEWREALPPNVWVGCTVEDQKRAFERLPWLLEVPAIVRFASVEPLLERVNLADVCLIPERPPHGPEVSLDALRGLIKGPDDVLGRHLDWVIVGGESDQPGAPARPCATEWIESVIAQCEAAKVPVFVKQRGSCVVSEERTAPADTFSAARKPEERFRASNGEFYAWRASLKNSAGADPEEWPENLRVRQFPEVRHAR